ncbi:MULTISPECIES: glycoside hydrolase family 30 protein [Streptomyces violaceusniger group]|uniref:Glucosylceramidase n=1 Tax=Streptomyces rhizosphaericus TaxID=114699 RepID=A0ABN1SCM0_9ACTN|nr:MULTISPECIES: glycoside hydrolase [Streptomyces violaceusniger group]
MITSVRTALVGALAAALLPLIAPSAAAEPLRGGSVDFGIRLQPIDGFGFSQAFQRADLMHGAQGLTPEHQREVLDLLLNRATGAGLSILRLGIGSSSDEVYDHMKSIQPADPGGPDAPPRYEWDGDDGGQVWLAQEARRYGVKRFYADAWSAPGYMKTNGTDANGGTLKPEWRRAYADYLVQYATFYRQEGVRITDLGFTNEPDLATSYASMRFTPEQAVEVVKAIGPTVRRAGINLVCCDAAGWDEQAAFSAAIEADGAAADQVAVHTGHPYVTPSDQPLPTSRRTWMSEWSPNGTTWNEAWDDQNKAAARSASVEGGGGRRVGGYDGLAVAEAIHTTLADAGASGYVYWFGASVGATRGLIQLDGPDYHVSKRLWALAAYSRFIRPGAVRVAADSGADGVKTTAFRNRDGRRVLEILNTGAEPVRTDYALRGADRGPARGAVYRTDETHALSRVGTARVRDGRLAVELPGRSLTTVVLR